MDTGDNNNKIMSPATNSVYSETQEQKFFLEIS